MAMTASEFLAWAKGQKQKRSECDRDCWEDVCVVCPLFHKVCGGDFCEEMVDAAQALGVEEVTD